MCQRQTNDLPTGQVETEIPLHPAQMSHIFRRDNHIPSGSTGLIQGDHPMEETKSERIRKTEAAAGLPHYLGVKTIPSLFPFHQPIAFFH